MENTEEIYTDFARVYDELMDNTPYEMWCERLDRLIAAYGVSKPERDVEGILDSERNLVVDLGCGTGTLTEMLYQKGYDCIGVDNSEEMLNIAMDKKAESGSEILYLHQDMRELDLYSTVGTVISVCDSVNYILILPTNTGKSSVIPLLRRTERIAVLSGRIITIPKRRSMSMISPFSCRKRKIFSADSLRHICNVDILRNR